MYNGILWETPQKGKMEGISSIGTACSSNPHCQKRRENGECVCSKCYAETYMKMRKALKAKLEENAEILTTRHLEDRELPFINARVYRFESFGDLYNDIHLENYIAICNHNPHTNFGLWTKNTWILDSVFNKKGIKRPENLSIVVSSPLLNKQMELDRVKHWYVDHVFTVYTKEYIEENNIDINCGAKSCLGCQLCYNRNTEFYIREKLK